MFPFVLLSMVLASPGIDRIATRQTVMPYAYQPVGYQFYARTSLSESLEERLRVSYRETFGEPSRTAGVRYDVVRQEAFDHCAALELGVRNEVPDTCTHIVYSPFLMVCEVSIVVTRECIRLRSATDGERFDGAFASFLSSHRTQFGAPQAEHVLSPEDRAVRQKTLGAAAQSL
jgi:hypothetical protein